MPVLQARSLSKTFPGVTALRDVSLEVEPGQVHAVTGENGAGKSTLMRILAGVHVPDSGDLIFAGRSVRLRSPHDALRAGIAMIHQEPLSFPDLTVAENISMGREPVRGLPGWVDRAAMRRKAGELLERLGLSLPPSRRMGDLSLAEVQVVAIARALACQAEVIIMDEPTSALSAREVEALVGVIQDLKRRGVAVIYVSHRLAEIFRISDAVTVLRDGLHVATRGIAGLDRDSLIALMVGRDLAPGSAASNVAQDAVALEVQGLSRTGAFRPASFQVRCGEILGIAGLVGAGRTELAGAISGMAPADEGEIRVSGRRVTVRTPGEALSSGIAMVTEDRARYGLVPAMSVKHNLTLASLARYCRGGFIRRGVENRTADRQIGDFGIRCPGRDAQVRFLSGGNQQKAVIARALLADPAVLILDEPTRGIDVGAKAEVYAIIRRLAREGKAVVIVSSEIEEILSMSDRILVMREGSITAELDPRHTSEEEVLKWAVPN